VLEFVALIRGGVVVTRVRREDADLAAFDVVNSGIAELVQVSPLFRHFFVEGSIVCVVNGPLARVVARYDFLADADSA